MNEKNTCNDSKNASLTVDENANCEHIFNAEPELTSEEQRSSKKSGRKKKAIIVLSITAAVILLIAGLLAYGVLKIGKSSKDGSFWIGSSDYAKAGNIYLVGETHAVERILEEKLRIWNDFYHNEGMRHYFVEYGYCTVSFLNMWMQADDNGILDMVYENWKGTSAHNQVVYDYFVNVKKTCPDTVFHCTDVEHQYKLTGAEYIKYLEENGMKDSEEYRLASEANEQGRTFYQKKGTEATEYREAKMAENFMREFDALGGISVFGVFGSNHTNYPVIRGESTPTLATAIYRTYGAKKLEVNNLSLKYKTGQLQ